MEKVKHQTDVVPKHERLAQRDDIVLVPGIALGQEA
jgi:hypothetical protein